MEIRDVIRTGCKGNDTVVQTLEKFLNGSEESLSRADVLLSAKFLLSELGVFHGVIRRRSREDLFGPRSEKSARFLCGACKKPFHNPLLFNLHIRHKHRNFPRFLCLKCPESNVSFTHRNLYASHQRVFHPRLPPSFSQRRLSPLSCPLCETLFESQESLFRHVKESHVSPLKSCNTCSRYGRFLSFALWRFLRDKTRCHTCQKGFNSYSELSGHRLRVHLGLTERCYDCDKDRIVKGFLLKGVERCKSCKKLFANKFIERHSCVPERIKKPFSCENCPGIFESQKSYVSHLKEVHGLSGAQNVCYICGISYNSKYYLESHIKSVHEKIRAFRCVTCGKELGCKTSLENHVNSVHLKLKRFRCETCGLRFGVKQRLTLHIRSVHLKIKDQKCPYCDALYVHRTTLKEHIKYTHQGQERVKRFMCDKCHKCFISNCSLQGHIKFAHYGLREYPCRICGKAFGTTNMRRKHERLTHNPEIKHRNPNIKLDVPCDVCHKMFGRKGTMERHKLLVHEERRDFVCDVCKKTFQQRCDLTKHFKKCHSV